MSQLINEPGQGSKNILAIIAVMAITAIVVGGGVYLQQKSAIKNERNETAETVRGKFQQEITDLKAQLSQLKETRKAAPVEIPTDEEIKPPESKEPVVKPPVDPTADWKTYRDIPFQNLSHHKLWGYEFKYPQEFILKSGDHSNYQTGSFLKAHHSGAGIQSVSVAVSLALPQSAYPDTNFQSAWLAISYDPDIANLPNCQELERNGVVEKMAKSQTVNEVMWYRRETSSGAAGTSVESRVYHTFHNDMCYEVALHLSTANIGNFDPALGIKTVNESAVWAKLESIFSTFRFIK